MEDAHTTLLSLGPEHPECAFYGVYDGHCGHNIARYCGENLHKRVVASPHFAAGDYGAAFQEVYVQFHTTRLLHLIIHSVSRACVSFPPLPRCNFRFFVNLCEP